MVVLRIFQNIFSLLGRKSVGHRIRFLPKLGKQDSSRQCQYFQSNANLFFNGKYQSNRQDIVKFDISISVEIYTLLDRGRAKSKICFLAAILSFFKNAISHEFQSCRPILLIFNSKYGTDFFFKGNPN